MAPNNSHSTGDYIPARDPLSKSLGIIEELSKSGIVLSPIKPTELMAKRGACTAGVTPEQARAVYFAMIALGG
jgi:hypothetical protein